MRIALLKNWANDDFSKNYYDQALDALSSSECLIMIIDEDCDDDKLYPEANQVSSLADVESDASDSYFKDSSETCKNLKISIDGETKKKLKKREIKNEIFLFRKKLSEEVFRVGYSTGTSRFWKENFSIFPNLFKLAQILLNIQASSAFIERFFSICGIICTKRNNNMGDELLIMRSLMKANIKTLKELNGNF